MGRNRMESKELAGTLHRSESPKILGAKHTNAANKGQLHKRGMSPQTWSNIWGGPGGKAFAKSERWAEIIETSVAMQMPLMGEFTFYSEWGVEAQKWTMMLYNRPVRLVIDYFIINLKDGEAVGGF